MAKAAKKKKSSKKKVSIKIKKPTWEGILENNITKYSLLILAIVVSLVVIDLGVQYLNNDFSVAVVNGTRISQRKFYQRLEQAYGTAIAEQLIEEQLIKQAAAEKGVSVTNEEINQEIDNIVEQIGGREQLDISLEAYNLTLEDLEEQIMLDLLVRKVIQPDLEYEEEDVKNFFQQYSDIIFSQETAQLEEGELLDYETYRERTLEIFLQQETEMARGNLLDKLATDARIQNNIVDRPRYRILGATSNILTNIFDEMNRNTPESE